MTRTSDALQRTHLGSDLASAKEFSKNLSVLLNKTLR
jgi:hypothetical protein